MTKKDHDVLIQLCQKVDDLASLVKENGGKLDPVTKLIQTHEEKLAWLQKGMVGAFAAASTAVIGMLIEVFRHIV